jgi:hypothetical protein
VYSGAVLPFFKLWFFLSYLSVIIFSYLDNNLICDCMMNYSSSYTLYYNCWVRLLTNYNIKYICTIYTRLDTCLMSISRFPLRDKVTLWLLKLYFNIADTAEWSTVLDIRLSDWCCSVSMVWVPIPPRKNTNVSAQRSNSNTVELNFQRYIYIAKKKSIFCIKINVLKRILKDQSKMDNLKKTLATWDRQDEEKQSKNTTEYVLNNILHKQT